MITRRSFLKLVGLAAAAGVVVPALQSNRAPYVLPGQVATYIGHCPGGFTGGQAVHEVLPWDGVGYPVLVWNNSFGPARQLEQYYDADLADMTRELPYRFWHAEENRKYPNVHTYIRVQRFGESMEQAIKHLNFVSSRSA
ncbi:MAG: twin-arginine translocation signal domain-containing protein [Pseudomonas sp.]|nr:twin-arginine translocation signal domain-containing protein [Pseudomonas sp.]